MMMTRIANRILTMPVKLARVGNIKIGRKDEKISRGAGGGEYQKPIKLDHILITTTDRDSTNNFTLHPIMKMLAPKGEMLRTIKCSLLFNDDRNFHAQFAQYDGKKLVCHGDGVRAMCGGSERACSCGREAFGYVGKDKCKATATLDVVLSEQTMSGGVFRLSTTSWNSISSIQGSLAYLNELTQGYIAGIPLVLTLLSKTAQLPIGGATKIFYIALQLDGTPEQIMARAMQRAQLMHTSQTELRKLALVAPQVIEMESVEEEEEFNGLIESEDLEEFGLVDHEQQNVVHNETVTETPKPRRSLADVRNDSMRTQVVTEPAPAPAPLPEPLPEVKRPAQAAPKEKRAFKRGDNVRLVRIDKTVVIGQILEVNLLRFVIDSDNSDDQMIVLQSDVEEITWFD